MRKPIVRQFCLAVLAFAFSLSLHAQNVQVSLDQGTATMEVGLITKDEKLVHAVEEAGYKATVA